MTELTKTALLALRRAAGTRGQVLRALRAAAEVAGMTAAVEAGISYATLSALENDHGNPSESTLQALASYYGVQIGDLYPA